MDTTMQDQNIHLLGTDAISGVKQSVVIQVAKELRKTLSILEGRSMIIMGAGINDWF